MVMKKNILFFIMGGIFFSTIAVYATMTYSASQITYKNTTLDHAIDELYTSANIEIYTPSGTITPSKIAQTIPTLNKKVSSDLIVDKIPTINVKLTSLEPANGPRASAILFTSGFSSIYKYFKITSLSVDNNSEATCTIIGYVHSTSSEIGINVNTKYNIGYADQIIVKTVPTSSTLSGRCSAYIEFSN